MLPENPTQDAHLAATLVRILTSPRTNDERHKRRRIERFIRDLIREELKIGNR
jgi:hypothetical protein